MSESFFELTRSRVIIAVIYTVAVGFLLAEKLWADYCYHIKQVLSWPDWQLVRTLLWTLPLAVLLVWFSFVYGHGQPSALPFSAVLVEVFFIALVLYTAWSVGLLRHRMPFKEFLFHAGIFVIIVGLFSLVICMTVKPMPHFADWMIGCLVLALACFGYYRAVSDCLGLSDSAVPVWHLRDFINFYKDMLIYVVIGAVLLQGALRITLVVEQEGSDMSLVVRAIFFAVYAVGCLVGVGVLAGAGDLMFMAGGEFSSMAPARQELVRFHIYLRDGFLVLFALGNSAWLYLKLFA